MDITQLIEALEDLNKQAEISKNALIKDNHNIRNKQGFAYTPRKNNGKHYNYRKVVLDLIDWVKKHDANLDEEIDNFVKELKDKHSYISQSKTDTIIMDDGNTKSKLYFKKDN